MGELQSNLLFLVNHFISLLNEKRADKLHVSVLKLFPLKIFGS